MSSDDALPQEPPTLDLSEAVTPKKLDSQRGWPVFDVVETAKISETFKFGDQPSDMPKVLGMDYDILIKFLKLFRDQYRKCEKATTFLEHRTDIANLAAIANQRDAISHFKSALQEGTTRQEQEFHLSEAQAHFQRAIIEPYELALDKKATQLSVVYEKYREEVLPVRERYEQLQSFPNDDELNNALRDITRLRDSARSAKGHTAWDEIWEKGVDDYIEGFNLAHDLLYKLENALYRVQQLKRDEEQERRIRELEAALAERDRLLEEREGRSKD